MDLSVVDRVRELIGPLLAGRGAELVELTCHPAGGRLVLRCLVDTARGVTLGELSGLNHAIGALIEEHNLIQDRYLLEVSSPGLDRRLKEGRDFERVIGRRVRVTLSAPFADRHEHRGEVIGANETTVVLRLDSGEKLQVPLSLIAHAVQEIELK